MEFIDDLIWITTSHKGQINAFDKH